MVDFTDGHRPKPKPFQPAVHKLISHVILLGEISAVSTNYTTDTHTIVVTLKSGVELHTEFGEVKNLQRYNEELLDAWKTYLITQPKKD